MKVGIFLKVSQTNSRLTKALCVGWRLLGTVTIKFCSAETLEIKFFFKFRKCLYKILKLKLYFFISEIHFSSLAGNMTGNPVLEFMRTIESRFNSALERFFTWWGVGKCTLCSTAQPALSPHIQCNRTSYLNINAR